MGLSNDLISQFVKVTKDNTKQKETKKVEEKKVEKVEDTFNDEDFDFELSEEDKKFGGEKAKEAYIYYANTFLNEMQ